MDEVAAEVRVEELPSAREAREALLGEDPRRARWLGVGSSMGLSGVSALTLGVRVLGAVRPSVTLSPLGTVDLSVHATLTPTRWAPQVGLGHVLGYRSDFAAGPGCGLTHLDLGTEFVPVRTFTFTAGLSLTDGDCSARLMPIPLPYVGTAWYFGGR